MGSEERRREGGWSESAVGSEDEYVSVEDSDSGGGSVGGREVLRMKGVAGEERIRQENEEMRMWKN